jgi:hypothetical protein
MMADVMGALISICLCSYAQEVESVGSRIVVVIMTRTTTPPLTYFSRALSLKSSHDQVLNIL